MTTRRAVITGLGAVAPGGIGVDAYWKQLTDGQSATGPITLFDPSPYRSRIAAEVDFDPVAAGLGPREVRRMDRATQFAVVAAREALGDSGLEPEATPAERTAVALGTAVGCTTRMEQEYVILSDSGRDWLVDPSYAVPELYSQFVPSSMAVELARLARAAGPVSVVSDGCTSGLDAVGHAVDLIQEGSADVVVSGGTDAPIAPITLACFDAIKATSPRNDDAEHASRPFDRTRNGLVLGEGAAVLVVEELEHARRRDAHIYAEVSGFATRCNAYHMTGLRADGIEMAEAIRIALDQSALAADDIDYVNAHGSSTRQNDRHETAAFKRGLGAHARRVPVSSIKSMIGHSLGAIGALELVACALAMEHGVIPPTANLHEPDPECDLDYVPLVAREQPVDSVLSVGSGFGGFQSAVVLARPDRRTP
ncbi:Tetracenomycin polyketide synthase ketoacyl synthase alpha subunit [Frankia sp. AiPs1]|uniref:beta-ketoacyl-[acyl-carrier-protein] synthase family protein n=1 Tax=Frankia sp. AiPa1 TaxID=573492 RepID=UPI00202B10A7|nr:beta-ketoacyl-[acyl-carrier-protein] synthase family protein [Frankia sp. AiPa1]MCL9760507.1 beta-ketoacyl-[acyl-carrier-protein] synthase family protein [Frankia sp. AiPa1]